MTTEQTSFNFTKPAVPNPAEVERLVAHLDHAGETWLTARELAQALGMTDRRIRQLAEHSGCRVVSGPGCPGYRHRRHCTPAMLAEVANRLESQARAMKLRAASIRRLAHAEIG